MDRDTGRSNSQSQKGDGGRADRPRMYVEIGSSSRGHLYNMASSNQPGRNVSRVIGDTIDLVSDGEQSPKTSPKRMRINENTSESGQSSRHRGEQGCSSADRSDDDSESESETKKMPKLGENSKESQERTSFSDKAGQMMKRMGHKEGEGLGRYGQGIVEPINASTQKGRRGFGQVTARTSFANIVYDRILDQGIMDVQEKVEWIDTTREPQLRKEDMRCWMVIGAKKLFIEDETNFCDEKILQDILCLKGVLDNYTDAEVQSARSRANPFEAVKSGIFINRAAMKLANLEDALNHIFSDPHDHHGGRMVGDKDLLYFADVCAGPGGFTEYILWLKGWRAKGLGFTLKGINDFKLERFSSGNPETFEPYYGVDDDGDITKPKNIDSFRDFVMENTDNLGVHYMLADGGFAVDGQENIQEILSKQLYLCQCLMGLMIIRNEGSMLCKLFDTFTPFTAGLIYLMYRSFHRITICKPKSSRPASSERYMVCQYKRNNTEDIVDYLMKICRVLHSFGKGCEEDVLILVPLSIMKIDKKFMRFLVKSNNDIGMRQINALAKVRDYLEDRNLKEEHQGRIRDLCYTQWGVKDRGGRKIVRRDASPDTMSRLLMENDPSLMDMEYEELKAELKSRKVLVENDIRSIKCSDLDGVLYPVHDWYIAVAGSDRKIGCFLSMGRGKNYFYNVRQRKWETFRSDERLELTPDTIVLGEVIQELSGELFAQRKVKVFHLIDAYVLGGTVVNNMHYTERMEYCSIYAKAVCKSRKFSVMPVRMKVVDDLDNIRNIMNSITSITMKNGRSEEVMKTGNNQFYIPKGFIFIKATQPPFERHLSSKHSGFKYYWAPDISAIFESERPEEAIATFRDAVNNIHCWWLVNEHGHAESPGTHTDVLKTLEKFVRANRNLKKKHNQ